MEEKMAMVNPRIETLLDHSENKFTLVIESAKRARQITNFQKRLGEGLGGVAPMRLEDISKKPLTIALEEIADGKIEYDRPADEPEDETHYGTDLIMAEEE